MGVPLLREDHLISKTCALEESVSHHFDKIVADGHHMWCDSQPGVDTSRVYVENH